MDFDEAWGVFHRKAGDEICAWIASRGIRLSRQDRNRVPVPEEQVLKAGRLFLQDMLDNPPEDPAYALREGDVELSAVVQECIAQALEEHWQVSLSPRLKNPDKRREMWWWIQERVGVAGRELLPAP